MKLMDLKDDQKNPIFKVLQVKEHKAEILKVSLYSRKIGMIWSLVEFGGSSNSWFLVGDFLTKTSLSIVLLCYTIKTSRARFGL